MDVIKTLNAGSPGTQHYQKQHDTPSGVYALP